jgi:hypothetical protein
LGVLALEGCASLAGVNQQYVVCSYDHTFEAAAETVKDRAIVKQDKATGVIQTAWLEIPMPGRKFGAFRREVQDSKDRSRLLIEIKRMNDVTQVSFNEEREAWAFRGGSRLFGWVPTDPSSDVKIDFESRLEAKLKERGCHTS